MKKQTVIGVLIGLLIGAGATYLWCPRNCESKMEIHGENDSSQLIKDSIQWATYAESVSDTSMLIPRGISETLAQNWISNFDLNIGLRGWYVHRNLFDDLLKPINFNPNDPDTAVVGLQCYLAKNDENKYTLIWGPITVDEAGESTFHRKKSMDYIDPCPNRCPNKGGF